MGMEKDVWLHVQPAHPLASGDLCLCPGIIATSVVFPSDDLASSAANVTSATALSGNALFSVPVSSDDVATSVAGLASHSYASSVASLSRHFAATAARLTSCNCATSVAIASGSVAVSTAGLAGGNFATSVCILSNKVVASAAIPKASVASSVSLTARLDLPQGGFYAFCTIPTEVLFFRFFRLYVSVFPFTVWLIS